MKEDRSHIFAQLQTDILRLQGFKPAGNSNIDLGLGPITQAFPNASFPLGAVHEFLSPRQEDRAATSGFIAGLLSHLMKETGTALWITSSRNIFPPALRNLCVQPDRFIFLTLKKEKDVLWAMDEALKCGALTAVVGEINDLNFKVSRRLQLAVEQSQVTGLIIRTSSKPPGITACVSRWKVTSLPCELPDELPGVGYPKWKIELLKIRNGRPGVWDLSWMNGRFITFYPFPVMSGEQQRKAG